MCYKLSVITLDGKSEWFVNVRQPLDILQMFIDYKLEATFQCYDKNSIELVKVQLSQVPHYATIYNIAFF